MLHLISNKINEKIKIFIRLPLSSLREFYKDKDPTYQGLIFCSEKETVR